MEKLKKSQRIKEMLMDAYLTKLHFTEKPEPTEEEVFLLKKLKFHATNRKKKRALENIFIL